MNQLLRASGFSRGRNRNNTSLFVSTNAAAGRTAGTDAVLGLEIPDALRIEEILRAGCTDRAEIDDVARQFVVERFA